MDWIDSLLLIIDEIDYKLVSLIFMD